MYLCIKCAPGVVATESNPELMPPTEQQRAELRALDSRWR
jgi:hypothetical protein